MGASRRCQPARPGPVAPLTEPSLRMGGPQLRGLVNCSLLTLFFTQFRVRWAIVAEVDLTENQP